MNCPSCNKKFDHEQAQAGCGSCTFLSQDCGKIRCPHCGYESVREPGLLGLISSLKQKFVATKPKPTHYECPGSTLLANLQAGEMCVVEKFLDVAQVRKFLSLGVLPGTYVTIMREKPVVVLRVGYSEFAVDRHLAKTVQVHRINNR